MTSRRFKRGRRTDGFELRRVVMLIKDIPRDVRDGFKAYCTRRGITMKQRLIELMKQDVVAEMEAVRRGTVLRDTH